MGVGGAGPGQASSNQGSPAGFAAPNKRLDPQFPCERERWIK